MRKLTPETMQAIGGLQRLFYSRSKSSTKDQGLPDEVQSGEKFTRFILSRSLFSPLNKRVKPQALMPALNQDNNRFETSTYRIAGLSSEQIWKLGFNYVANAESGRNIKARGTGDFALIETETFIQAMLMSSDGLRARMSG